MIKVAANDLYYRIFVYSVEQKKEQEAIAKMQGKTYTPGNVIVKGRQKPYTDIVLSMDKVQYGDSIIVAKGDMRRIAFTNPS